MSAPEGALRAAEYTVETVPMRMAKEFIEREHYAQGASNTATFRHGLFRRDNPLDLLGVALWMPPTKPAALAVASDWRTVLCLSRLAVSERVPQNGASFLLGRSIRLVRSDGRYRHLLTYADTSRGHTGAIYLATNWVHDATVRSHKRWADGKGRQVSIKAGARSRTHAEMAALGYVERAGDRLHRFVMHFEEAA